MLNLEFVRGRAPDVDAAAAFLVELLDGADRAVATAVARPPEDASWGIRVDAAQPPDEEADEEARNFTI